MRNRLVSFVLGELTEPQRSQVAAHVAECDECRAELKQLGQLLECAGCRKGLSADESLLESARTGLLAAVNSEEPRIIARPDFRRAFEWRRIMASPIAKMAVAATIVVAVGLFGVSKLNRKPPIRFLAVACAAEEALFTGTEIMHIQNEIIVEPAGAEPSLPYAWLPMCSMKPDGTLRFNQLKMNLAPESYVVTDHSWYDPVTGRFARVLKAGDSVVFANSYDGRFIYDANVTAEGANHINKQALAAGFEPPQSPAEYLGLAAGLKSGLAKDSSLVQKVEEGTLPDGEPAHIYTVGTPDPNGRLQGYWLFKVRDEDSTIAEKEFVLRGRTLLVIRRVLTERVEAPGVSWGLAEIEGTATRSAAQVTVTPDMVVRNVSIQHMVDRAKFETYVFAVKPAWTSAIEITDCIDPASEGGRMFIMTARADDHRHLVLVQSPTYNMALGQVVKAGQIVYTSPNGFKVWGGGPQKWYSQILLQSAQASIKDPPSEDRIGYILESPAGTFPALAINGPVGDEELHKLVDSLVPAKDALKAGQK
ncbi:MAG: zf-HC2 domain-containing protein [Sedimentisphaerales bacterium]|nr:zf-HC2 domain-containing protein [Sedimentisphaerales bacterium]